MMSVHLVYKESSEDIPTKLTDLCYSTVIALPTLRLGITESDEGSSKSAS
jgi:hypothetical protein